MTRRRLSLLVAAVAAVVLLAAGGWVLATDVGAPEDAFVHTPQPCELLPDPTLQTLVGDATGQHSAPYGDPSWRPLHRGEETRRCDWAPADDESELRIDVQRYHSTQLGLGRTGAERAEDATASLDGCGLPLPTEVGQACVRHTDPVDLTVRRHNVTVRVFFARYTGAVGPDPEALAQRLAGEVASALARLEDGPLAHTPL